METRGMSDGIGAESGQPVMPFYLVFDVSYSMTNEMNVLNDSLNRLRRAIVSEPSVDDVARISVITFSDDANVVLPLTQLSDAPMPQLAVEGGTCYGAAFTALRTIIEKDSHELKAVGAKVFRPCAFFLTDGEPNDHDWAQVFKDNLTYNPATGVGMRAHPIFVPFGFRDANPDMMKKLAYPRERGKWFLASSTSPEKAVEGILDLVMRSVLVSSRGVGTNQAASGLAQPAPGSGITSGDAEYDLDIL